MSETNENLLVQNAEAYVAERWQWLEDAAEVVTGTAASDPRDVFPAATEVRADGEALALTEAQEAELREVAGRFGLGGEIDIPAATDYELLEGGKPWKVEAEAAISNGIQIFAGSPHRAIGKDEATYMQTRTGADPTQPMTEYEMVARLAAAWPGFEALPEPVVLPFGYDIAKGHALVQAPTGQLQQIGTRDGKPVFHLRIDRENYVDEAGKTKYRNQPDSAAVMGFVADVLSANGDKTTSVGLLTSSSYASRAVDAVRAGLAHERKFAVGMYGRQTLADVKSESVAAPTGIEQIPGELHVIADKLILLQEDLENRH